MHCKTSPTRLYAAVAGRAGSFADLIPRLAELTTSLDQQTADIIAAAEGLNRFAGILARSKDSLGPRSRLLARRAEGAQRQPVQHRRRVHRAAESSPGSRLTCCRRPRPTSPPTSRTCIPVIKAVNDNVDDFISDLELLPTFPFHYKYLRNAVRGDYLNVFVTFDLTVRRTGESVFTTSMGLDPNMKHLDEVVNPPDFLTGAMANLSGQAVDPFTIPPGTATQHGEGRPRC